MRSSRAVFAALMLMGSAGAAEATNVTQNLSGTIYGTNTIDTLGLFGPAGADLVGKPISIYFKYTTEDIPIVKTERNGYTAYRAPYGPSSSTTGSILVTVIINGTRHVYAPSYFGQVLVRNIAPYVLSLDVDANSGFLLTSTGPGLQVNVQYHKSPTFGSPLSPANNPVLNQTVDALFLLSPANGGSQDYLDFYVSSATK